MSAMDTVKLLLVLGALSLLIGADYDRAGDNGARCLCLPTAGLPMDSVVASRFEAADVVVHATMLPHLPADGDRPFMARLTVHRWWKGGAPDSTVLVVATRRAPSYGTTCDYTMAPGRSYVLFLQHRPEGWLHAGSCGGSAEIGTAAADTAIHYLDALRRDSGLPAGMAPLSAP
jgi:hypothetical protein